MGMAPTLIGLYSLVFRSETADSKALDDRFLDSAPIGGGPLCADNYGSTRHDRACPGHLTRMQAHSATSSSRRTACRLSGKGAAWLTGTSPVMTERAVRRPSASNL